MRIFGHKPTITAWVGIVIVAFFILMALFGPLVAPYEEAETIAESYAAPTALMWFGADQIGRDLLTRVIYGARTTIGIAFVTTILSFAIGIVMGLWAVVGGKIVDQILSRIVDVMLSIPLLIFALIILSLFGSLFTSVIGSLTVLVFVIAVLDSTRVFRLSRSVAMNIVVLEYVEAARLRGEGTWWIIRREILPNALPPMISEFGLRFCFNFLFVAALSFLGLGVQPPLADWGGMVKENAKALGFGGMAPLWPAAAIALMTIGVNLIVDWILSINARPSGASAEM
ncbi:ABC transporter permease [Dongia sp.]|uniref:ABC transporter permease n=1 Tax=Dongia sp. TaxID=1977262 RepID=UPI0037510704